MAISRFDLPGTEGVVASLEHVAPDFLPEVKTLVGYTDELNDPDSALRILQYTLRTYVELCDFSDGKGIGKGIKRATLLQAIGEAVMSQPSSEIEVSEQTLAIQALREYRSTQPPKRWRKTAAFLVDGRELRTHLDVIRDHTLQGTEIASIIDSNDDEPVSKALWNFDLPPAPLERIDAMLNHVNVEAVNKESIRHIDRLKTPARKDTTILRHIFDSQVFAKINEAMGFDGVAMALRSAANVLRLKKLGLHSVVEEAQKRLEPYDRKETLQIVDSVLHDIFGGSLVSKHCFEDNTDHDIIVGESRLQRDIQGEDPFQVVWRRKSLGSYAMKMFKRPGQKVLDMVGLTIVVDNMTQLCDVFCQMQLNIYESNHATLASNDPTVAGLDVRGDKAYIETIKNEMCEVGLDVSTIKEDLRTHKKEFRVVKAAIDFDGTPVEIMIQTRADRHRARVGKRASHDGYKVGGERLGGLKCIQKRVNNIGAGIIGYSKQKSYELDELLDRAA